MDGGGGLVEELAGASVDLGIRAGFTLAGRPHFYHLRLLRRWCHSLMTRMQPGEQR